MKDRFLIWFIQYVIFVNSQTQSQNNNNNTIIIHIKSIYTKRKTLNRRNWRILHFNGP